MDTMTIKKGGLWSKELINPRIEKKLKEKTGVEADINVGLEATTDEEGKTHIHIDLDGDLSKEGWKQLMRLIGVPKIVTNFL